MMKINAGSGAGGGKTEGTETGKRYRGRHADGSLYPCGYPIIETKVYEGCHCF